MQTRPRASVAVESAKERSRKIVWKFELLLKLRPEMAHNSPSPPHTHTHTQSQQRLVRARAILRGRLTRERERLAELVDGGTSDVRLVGCCVKQNVCGCNKRKFSGFMFTYSAHTPHGCLPLYPLPTYSFPAGTRTIIWSTPSTKLHVVPTVFLQSGGIGVGREV